MTLKSICCTLIIILYCNPINHYSKENHFKFIKNIPVPNSYIRVNYSSSSFCSFLRNLPLKTENNTVYLYNGEKKINQTAQYSVLKMYVGKKDLQQCADAVMRLRGEYLYKQKKYSKIKFNFTNGDTVRFTKYAEGNRPTVRGNKVIWKKKKKPNYTYPVFRNYMNLIFMYAGTASLSRELTQVQNINSIQCGNTFVQQGNPYGHAVIVIDLAIHLKTKKKVFLLAQSYMPAQEIHILNNPNSKNLSPWYELPNNKLITPEWVFNRTDLRKF